MVVKPYTKFRDINKMNQFFDRTIDRDPSGYKIKILQLKVGESVLLQSGKSIKIGNVDIPYRLAKQKGIKIRAKTVLLPNNKTGIVVGRVA